MFDLEMIREIGYCHGIENYSRHLTGRRPGQPPPTLLDYLPPDALVVIDESHQTVPQIRGMYHGDRSRKEVLVEYGFRLPSALDNRPLNFEEWEQRVQPAGLRLGDARPLRAAEGRRRGRRAGDPPDRPDRSADRGAARCKGQVDDLLAEIRDRAARERARAGDDADQAHGRGPDARTTRSWASRCRYLHSDIDTLERVEILRDLRRGEFDVLVGINLLREGLDLPEVSLVAILDADKEGFLRSGGLADPDVRPRRAQRATAGSSCTPTRMTDSMRTAINETDAPPRAAGGLQRRARHHARPPSSSRSTTC